MWVRVFSSRTKLGLYAACNFSCSSGYFSFRKSPSVYHYNKFGLWNTLLIIKLFWVGNNRDKEGLITLLCPVKWKKDFWYCVNRKRHRIKCAFKLLLKQGMYLKILYIQTKAHNCQPLVRQHCPWILFPWKQNFHFFVRTYMLGPEYNFLLLIKKYSKKSILHSFVIKICCLWEVAGTRKWYCKGQVNLAWSFWCRHCCAMTLTWSKIWEVTVLWYHTFIWKHVIFLGLPSLCISWLPHIQIP